MSSNPSYQCGSDSSEGGKSLNQIA